MFDIIVIYPDLTNTRQSCAGESIMWCLVKAAQSKGAAAIFVYNENRLVWQWGGAFEE